MKRELPTKTTEYCVWQEGKGQVGDPKERRDYLLDALYDWQRDEPEHTFTIRRRVVLRTAWEEDRPQEA